jgi:hypothetical protein
MDVGMLRAKQLLISKAAATTTLVRACVWAHYQIKKFRVLGEGKNAQGKRVEKSGC